MKRRNWMMLVLIVAIGLILTACGSNNKGTETTGSTKTTEPKAEAQQDGVQPVKLRIVWWGAQTRHDATLKVLEAYTAKYPHVTFEPEFSGIDGYADKLATQAAGKNAPDIIQMDPPWLAEYAGRDQLADLSEGINTEHIDATLVDAGKYDGKLYAVAIGKNATGMVYNKDTVEKMGITAPANGWTWEQHFQFGYDVKAKLDKDKYALKDATYDYIDYTAYQLSKGKGDPITFDGKFNVDKDTYIEFVNKYAELREDGIVPPAEISVTDKEADAKQDLINNGSVIMKRSYAALFPGYEGINPDAYSLVAMPKGSEASGWLRPSMFWSVSANSKHVEEAKKFIDWFVNGEEAADILTTTRGVPVSSAILDYLTTKLTPIDQVQIELIKAVAPDAQAFNPGAQGWSNYTSKDFKDVGEALMFNQMTAEEAYEELVKKAKDYE